MNSRITDAGQSTDEELYRRYLGGDSAALEMLIERLRASMTLFIDGFIHSTDEAESLMLDAFVRIIQSNGRFEGRSSFKTYLFGIAKNLALQYIRHNKRHISIDAIEETASGDDLPDAALLLDERRRQLYMAMRELKPEHREVLHLLYFEDMSYLEAGYVMKKSKKQIDGLAYRAKTALRKKLELGEFSYADV